MNGVFNLGNKYNFNNQKISSKATFEVGEKFSGKIVKKEDSNEVVIKLIDGREIKGEIEGDIDLSSNGITKFQIEGFENGKLKLKVLEGKVIRDEIGKGEFNNIILKEGLSKEDINLLKDMVKFNIPLTKENILEFKGLLQFLDKINNNSEECEEFISKYLISRGIEDSQEVNKVNNVLKNFFLEFKTLSKDDILLFWENDIDLNTENIKSFNELFKSKDSITKLVNNLKSSLFNDTSILEKENKLDEDVDITKSFEFKKREVISENKTIGNSYTKNEFNSSEVNRKLDLINKLNNDFLELSKGEIEELLSEFTGEEIRLTENEFINVKDEINLKLKESVVKENSLGEAILDKEKVESIKDSIKEILIVTRDEKELSTSEIVKDSIKKTGDANKEILKDLLTSINYEDDKAEKIVSIIKKNINEIKLFNKISSEYYYADIPVNIKEREYPCKIIIKNDRKDTKKIDTTNIKMVVTVDTKNLGVVDGYMKVLDKKIYIDLKCEEGYVKILDMAKNKLITNISDIGFLVDVRVSKKEKEVSLTTCRDFFNPTFGGSIDSKV